jgi:hypothetical protein
VIWLGWTSNCFASSDSVRSPFTAATATFALKAGECVRRARLVIVLAPVSGTQTAVRRECPLIELSNFPGPPLAVYAIMVAVLVYGALLSMTIFVMRACADASPSVPAARMVAANS